MTDKRKMLKVNIPVRLVDAFDRAKKRAEQQAGCKISDSQFASRMLAYQLERMQ